MKRKGSPTLADDVRERFLSVLAEDTEIDAATAEAFSKLLGSELPSRDSILESVKKALDAK